MRPVALTASQFTGGKPQKPSNGSRPHQRWPLRAGLSLVPAAILGLVIAASAQAHRSDGIAQTHVKRSNGYSPYAQIRVKRSNGYWIGIDAVRWKHPRRHGEVTVSVFNRTAESLYTAPAKLTRHGLEASLGRFGKIAVHFQPSARDFRSPERGPADRRAHRAKVFAPSGLLLCNSIAESGSNGRFKGRIQFRGEDGYVRVGARTATALWGW